MASKQEPTVENMKIGFGLFTPVIFKSLATHSKFFSFFCLSSAINLVELRFQVFLCANYKL